MVNDVLKLNSSWEYLEKTELPIILYGTGNGADRVLDELGRLGISICGIMASDGFVRKRQFRGFEVKSLADFENELSDFAVAVCFGSDRQEVIDNIVSVSKRHKLIVPCVPVYGDEIINREFIERNAVEIEKVYSLLADEKSKDVFKNFLSFELTGELQYLFLSETEKDEAFEGILKLNNNESYLDLGAYRGDTIKEFLNYTGGKYESITAVEPDSKSFEKLREFALEIESCELINKGIWSENTTLDFGTALGRGNSFKEGGKSVEAVSVDGICKDREITYIKADIEGCEAQMLSGAKETLKKHRPKLNIAAYHRSEDFFKLLLMIHKINDGYKIYIRHHRYIPCWDLNLYCV